MQTVHGRSSSTRTRARLQGSRKTNKEEAERRKGRHAEARALQADHGESCTPKEAFVFASERYCFVYRQGDTKSTNRIFPRGGRVDPLLLSSCGLLHLHLQPAEGSLDQEINNKNPRTREHIHASCSTSYRPNKPDQSDSPESDKAFPSAERKAKIGLATSFQWGIDKTESATKAEGNATELTKPRQSVDSASVRAPRGRR